MKDKFKIFISLGMNGKSDEEVYTRINAIKENCINHLYSRGFDREDIEFIDTYVQNDAPDCVNPRLWYLGESIKRMRDANLVYLDDDFDKYNGCRVESYTAYLYKIPTVYKSEINGLYYITYPDDIDHTPRKEEW